jgi:acyl carrier protein
MTVNSFDFLFDYFVKREGELILQTIRDLDLIDSGLMDSLDLIEISEIISENTGVQLDLDDESTFIAMRKIDSLIEMVNKKLK